MILTSLLLLSFPAVIDITIAPDQPIPFVYCDDPLILEIQSDTDVHVSGSMKFTSISSGKQTETTISPFYVYAGTSYWYVVEEAPTDRGYFNISLNLLCNDQAYKKDQQYCRIDRPTSLQRIPIYAHCGGDSRTCVLTALRSIGIETIHFNASSEYLDILTDEAALLGQHITLSLSPQQLQQMPEYLAEVVETQCENILRFEMDCQGIEKDCNAFMDAFRQNECPAGMSVTVPDAAFFSQLLAQSPNLSPRHISLTADPWPEPDTVRQIRYIAAQYGTEGVQIHVANPNWFPRENQPATHFLQRFFGYRAACASHIGLNAAVVADDMGVQEMLAYLNGLALHFFGQTYVGDCSNDASVTVPLFRHGANWLAVIWANKSGSVIRLAVSGTITPSLYDAFGNSIQLNDPAADTLKIDCGPVPVYLTGTGGALFGTAAENELKEQAEYFLSQNELIQNLKPTLVELIEKIASEPRSNNGRLRFLELISAIPVLEEQWHTRQVPKHIIVPAIMQVSDMAKTMAILEEDRGELFLEPLSDTLSRTEESQSLYLTGSAGTAKSRERGDWILSEVRRLVDETEVMEQSGRKIEAAAIAALAEARGACLKFAAQADVPQDAPELLPQPSVPAAVQEGALQQDEEAGEEEVPSEPDTETTEPPAEKETSEKKAEKEKTKEKKEAAEKEEKAGEDENNIHVVVSGDNPYDISRKYNIKLDDLLKWNNLEKNSVIQIGQKLIIRAGGTE